MEQSETTVPRLVKDLHFDVLKDLFNLLNREAPIASDWRTLASELGLSYDNICVLEREKNPASAVLRTWMSQDGEKNVRCLIAVLKKTKRFDAVKLLKKHEFTADESDSALQPAATAISSGDESHHALQPAATAISSGGNIQKTGKADNIPGFVYDMKKGFVLLINNYKFEGMKDVRKGAEVDAENLEQYFKEVLHFDFVKRENLSKEDLWSELYQNSKMDFSKYDSFFLFISSHGNKDGILGTNWEPIAVDAVTGLFTANL